MKNISHPFSNAYHQQANPVERRVQELKKTICIRMTGRKEHHWEVVLSNALQVLRASYNRATGTTPESIALGYDMPCPGEWTIKSKEAKRLATPKERGPGEIVAVHDYSTYEVVMNGKPSNRHPHDLRPAPLGNDVDPSQDDFSFASRRKVFQSYAGIDNGMAYAYDVFTTCFNKITNKRSNLASDGRQLV